MGKQYKKRRLTARAKRLRLLTATFLVLVIAFFAVTVPFWMSRFRVEHPDPAIHTNACIGIWSGLNGQPLTFWSLMAIMLGGFGIPILSIGTLVAISEGIKD